MTDIIATNKYADLLFDKSEWKSIAERDMKELQHQTTVLDFMAGANWKESQLSPIVKKIHEGVDRELQRQKDAGKEFLSDEAIDKLVDDCIKESLIKQ